MNVPESKKKKVYKSFGGFGVDVSLIRMDDLDKKILEHLQKNNKPKVLDLGAGAGGQSLRMCIAGARVWAVDNHDFFEEYEQMRENNNIAEGDLRFIKGDIKNLPSLILDENFFDVLLQRTLHYLSYQEALRMLEFLRLVATDKLFISVTGMESAVGEGYVGKNVEIEKRLFKLLPKPAETFQIYKPVCLYQKMEFIELLEVSGWKIEEIWSSAFGNHKAVCSVG